MTSIMAIIKNTTNTIPKILLFGALSLDDFWLFLFFKFVKNVMPEYTAINTVMPNNKKKLIIQKPPYLILLLIR